MFGCVAAGRPVQTNLLAISPTQFTLILPTSPAQPLNHLVIFLLPDAALPPDTAATVYIQLSPNKPFRLLGAIANEKPSAIFRIKGLDGPASGVVDLDEMTDEAPTLLPLPPTNRGDPNHSSQTTTEVTLGISIEPLYTVQTALASIPSTTSTATTTRASTPLPPFPSAALVPVGKTHPAPATLLIARRIIKNAFNYLSSFAVMVPGVPGDVVPLRSFQDWWLKFEKKLEFDPAFLERDDE